MSTQLKPGKASGKDERSKGEIESTGRAEESYSSNHSEGIRALQTVLSSGERVTVLVVGNSIARYKPLFEKLAQEIKNRHHPLFLLQGKGVYSRQETIKFLRQSTKVIAVELSNGSGKVPGSTASEQMSFPDVLHWSALLGLPPEVVLKGGKQAEFSLEKLLEEIGLEKG